jgi:hypothetical protein
MSHGPAIGRYSAAAARTAGPGASSLTTPAASLPPAQSEASAAGTRSADVPARPPASSPPSRRKRLAAALITPAILLTAVVGGHALWTWQAERRIDRFVADLRERGEATSMAEFTPAVPVPDTDNAAIDLRAAGESIVPDTEAWQSFVNTGPLGLPLTGEERRAIRNAVEANAEVFERVRQAMGRPTIEWTGVLPSPGRMSSMSPWGQRGGMGFFRQRGVSQLLYAAAMLAHEDGDDETALARIEELLFLTHATAARPTMRSQVAGIRIQDIALVTLAELVPDLEIAKADPAPGEAARRGGGGPASPARVRALIAKLLDDSEVRGQMVRSVKAERARHIESITGDGMLLREPGAVDAPPWADPLAIPMPASKIERFLSRPVHLARAQRALERFNLAIESFAAPDLREFITAFPDTAYTPAINAAGEVAEDRTEDAYAKMLATSIQQVGRMHYVSLARRRTAGLALALRLYSVEQGRWPTGDMSEMVPRYLPQVPGDPLSTAGEPLIFLPDPRRPRVYSVGEDGIDDGGWPPDPYASRPEDLRMTDWVVDLARQPRVTPPLPRR